MIAAGGNFRGFYYLLPLTKIVENILVIMLKFSIIFIASHCNFDKTML